MAPGLLSREGFLGDDRRPLQEIIESDRSRLAALGLAQERVAGALQEMLENAVAGQGAPVSLGPRLRAVCREAMGRIPCPWGACGVLPKGEVEVTQLDTGERFILTPLSVHLIARHGFFQGRGSRYRLEPDALARFLALVP